VNVDPHFGHLILVSLLTMFWFIPAQPAKLTITANANTAFLRFFTSHPPFPFEKVACSAPGASDPFPVTVGGVTEDFPTTGQLGDARRNNNVSRIT
jgi:hypothetical protein